MMISFSRGLFDIAWGQHLTNEEEANSKYRKLFILGYLVQAGEDHELFNHLLPESTLKEYVDQCSELRVAGPIRCSEHPWFDLVRSFFRGK